MNGKPRSYYGKLGAWASIILNLFLFIIKIILGIFTGSVALVADAFHSLSDMATSLIVLISFFITAKPSDEKHPFGHGRAEFISAIIMSTLLTVTAFELMQSSVRRIIEPTPFIAPWWVIGIITLTVFFKEGLDWFSLKLSKKIRSDALLADAWHHRLDAISSILVVIAFVLSRYNFPYLDGPAGLLISMIIIYSAFKIVKGPIDHLLGILPDEALLSKIEKYTLQFEEVKGVHDVIIHNYGEATIISLHIEVDENLSFVEAHQIAEKVDQALRREINAHVTVHFDPVMERTPDYKLVEKILQQFCQENPECESFHDLRVYGKGDNISIYLDLVPSLETNENGYQEMISQCEAYIYQRAPHIKKISIKVEPKFSITRRSRHN
ncbi:MAG: cation transporter [bacterium]|nr:MAG: cation transporter [bacterium]